MHHFERLAGPALGIGVVLVGLAGLPAIASAATVTLLPGGPGAVPPQYATEYSVVAGQLKAFTAAAAAPAPRHPKTKVGVELLAANGNIGPGLLRPGAVGGVEAELDAFRAMGVQGVTVDVSFPLLLKSTPNHARYLAFFEHVASQIRSRHMTFSVEENPVFAGTPLTGLAFSYAGLTLSSYATEQRTQAQTIINDLKPDYLSLLTEPDTYTDTFHIDLDTPSAAAQVVKDELAGLHRHSTKVGAGAGTWSSPSIDEALLARTSIDYLDVHVYPLDQRFVANLATDVGAAKSARKPLVMDETWLNKPSTGEGLGPIGAPENLKVKSYSFWEPLDEDYVTAMTRYARSHGFAYIAFFDGARAFFGYLTWTPALDAATYQAFTEQYNALVSENMRSLSVSGTGESLVKALSSKS